MTGTYNHNVDAKGRIFIPSALRDELGERFFVTLSMEKCLSAYPLENWNVFREKVMAMPKARQIKMRPLFSHAVECVPDSQGRILLPQVMRDFAGLRKSVSIVGNNECVEFWDSELWAETDALDLLPENLEALYMELD